MLREIVIEFCKFYNKNCNKNCNPYIAGHWLFIWK